MKNEYNNPEYKSIISNMKIQLQKTRIELDETDKDFPHLEEIIQNNWSTQQTVPRGF